MKQKIVIKVPMNCDKCRTKALKIAAVAKGVSSVSLEGEDKDLVAVTGERVDSVYLAKALRKKFQHVNIVSVEQVKDKKDKKEELPIPLPWYNIHYPPNIPYCEDQYGTNCIIM